ncbi:hypothetical protein Tco_0801836 [Tanacetum coccineum]|uniref:Uncharacterized protein n=1 Tax=Tanacetum coccineum TaxID=301880 RepID=A0ABQ5A1D5_9ASTR
MVGELDVIVYFEPEGGFADGEGNSPSNRCVNNEVSIIDVAPLNSAPPSHVDENVGDSDDVSLGGGIVEKAERFAGDASDPLDVDSDPDIHGKFYTFSASSVLSTSLESSCSPSYEILTLDLLRPIELQGIAIVVVSFGVGVLELCDCCCTWGEVGSRVVIVFSL